MREIKFRGQTITGEWVHGLLSISQGKSGQPEKGIYISNRAGMPWAYQVRPETVGQYTGLKDRNGVEIFEGNIIRWDDGTDGKLWRVAHVIWEERGQWAYKIIPSQCVNCFQDVRERLFGLGSFIYTPDSTKHGNILEVIGNIYETPELIEQ